MIFAVEARNFRSFGEQGVRLDLHPFTILVGPNGSGKSSVLDAIGVLAQTAATLRNPQLPAGLAWQGEWSDMGAEGVAAFHRGDRQAVLRLSVAVPGGTPLAQWQERRGFASLLDQLPELIEYSVENRPAANEWWHTLRLDGEVAARREAVSLPSGLNSRTYEDFIELPSIPELKGVHLRPHSGPPITLHPNIFHGFPPSTLDAVRAEKISSKLDELHAFLGFLSDSLAGGTSVVGADRAGRGPDLRPLGPGPLRVGRHGEHTIRVLSTVFAKNEFRGAAEDVRRWARTFGLEGLSSGWAGSDRLEDQFQDGPTRAALPVGCAGFGSQQILPVITQLFCGPAGSLVMVEEPEISLHPGAQVDAARMFAFAVSRGLQVLVTTHSQALLLALQRACTEFGVLPADLAVYHFSREGSEPKVEKLDVNENFYIPGWVPSFSEVEKRLITEWFEKVRQEVDSGS